MDFIEVLVESTGKRIGGNAFTCPAEPLLVKKSHIFQTPAAAQQHTVKIHP